MKSWWLMATILAAVLVAVLAVAGGLESVVAIADDIAVSLVNPKGRIDIPVSAITRVEAMAALTFRNKETGKIFQDPSPHVELCYTEDVHQRICQLTRQIVGQPLVVVINCETATKPIVREPLCSRPCLDISTNDVAEATALAQ
jgi:hypothetical protein